MGSSEVNMHKVINLRAEVIVRGLGELSPLFTFEPPAVK